MSKHRPRRGKKRYQRYLRGAVEENLSLGTLNTRTAIKLNFASVVNERTFVSSIKATWSLSEFTNAVGRGPIEVGYAHSDYSATEILEYLTQTGSWNETDQVSQEISKRKIRRVGVFQMPEAGVAVTTDVVLNDGKPITTKLGWILTQSQTVALWGFNSGSVAVAVTTPRVRVLGHANLWPK